MKQEFLNTIRTVKTKYESEGFVILGVFGSFARGDETVNSDVDILVEFNPLRKTFDNYMDLKFFFENLFHRKVDLVMKSALKLRIKNRVLSEVVYARL